MGVWLLSFKCVFLLCFQRSYDARLKAKVGLNMLYSDIISSSSPYKNDQTHICYTHELEEFIFIYFHIFLNIPSYHIGASSIKWSVSLVSEISRYS